MFMPLRNFATNGAFRKPYIVTLIGAAGGIGRHAALFLKLNNSISELVLYDNPAVFGIAEDLSHVSTTPKVTAYSGDKDLEKAVGCCNLLLIAMGQSHSENHKTREAMFNANCGLIEKIVTTTANANCGEMPFIHIITNPVTAMVPLCAELLKDFKCYNPNRISGSTAVNDMRARTFVGAFADIDPSTLSVPVIGGHLGPNVVPLISQREPHISMTPEEEKQITDKVINSPFEVTSAKENKGSVQLAVAYCVGHFCDSVIKAYLGSKNVMETAFVPSDINELDYFTCRFSLDHNGIKDFGRLPQMSPYEFKLYKNACKDIEEHIKMAKDYAEKVKSTNKNQNIASASCGTMKNQK